MYEDLLEGLKEIWANAQELKKKEYFKFNEANTKEVIITKVLKLLGWRLEEGEISLEYPVRSERNSSYSIDYALMLKGNPKIIVECKSLTKTLGEQEATQVMKYAFFSKIPWAILTNGKIWIVSKPDYHQEFFRFDISQPDKSLNEIMLLTRESLEAGSIMRNFEEAYTAQIIDRFINDNKKNLVDLIHGTDNKLNKETITRLMDRLKIAMEEFPPGGGNGFGFPLDIFTDYNKQKYYAKLFKDGKVEYNGKMYGSPSGASVPIVAPYSGRNGWTFWHLASNGEEIKTIRDQIEPSEKEEGKFSKRLNKDQLKLVEMLKRKTPEISSKIEYWEVTHYFALGVTPKNFTMQLCFASFHKRKNGLKVEIRIPYENLSNPDKILRNANNPDSYSWWNKEISIATIESLQDIDKIFPALKAAYDLMGSRYDLG